MKQASYRAITLNSLARQAGLEPHPIRKIKLLGFGNQLDDLVANISEPHLGDIPLHRDYSTIGSTTSKIPQKQSDFTHEPERTMTIKAYPFNAEETSSLANIAGSYANDPNWNEFLEAMENSRRESDELIRLAE